MFTQGQPQSHYIILKYKNRPRQKQTINLTSLLASTICYNTVNITNLLTVEVIISKSGFQSFKQVRMCIWHKGTVLRRNKVEVRHSNLYIAPP